MKKPILVAIYSCVFLGACRGEYSSKPVGITTKREGLKISFGIYDISKSFSFSDLFTSPEPQYQKGVKAG
jgi:hypothetical protein